MARYILMRLAGLIPVLLILSMITFILMHEVPGGPWKYGQRLFSDEQLAALKARYGLDKPLWQQYLIWLSGVVRFDFGMSFKHPDESVLGLIGRTWPTTMHLGAMALIVAFGAGLPLGVIAALKQNTWVDYIVTLVSTLGFVMPHFVWGILFILVFALALKWVPTGGWESPKQWSSAGRGLFAGAHGYDRALHPRQRRRGDALRLHPHRARQRAQRKLDRPSPRAEKRHDPLAHRLRPDCSRPHYRLYLHRSHLFVCRASASFGSPARSIGTIR